MQTAQVVQAELSLGASLADWLAHMRGRVRPRLLADHDATSLIAVADAAAP